ncbi:hypothetical protein ACNKHV_14485 [Shigella flexneri]
MVDWHQRTLLTAINMLMWATLMLLGGAVGELPPVAVRRHGSLTRWRARRLSPR